MLTISVVARIVVIVIRALLCEPIAMQISALPKKKAALRASSTGFKGSPCEISGPLARNPPTIAMMTPNHRIAES